MSRCVVSEAEREVRVAVTSNDLPSDLPLHASLFTLLIQYVDERGEFVTIIDVKTYSGTSYRTVLLFVVGWRYHRSSYSGV